MAGGPGGKEVGRVSIKIAPDSSDFIGEVRRLVREAEGQKVTIGVELDDGKARAQLKALTSSFGNEKATVNVDADTAAATTKIRVVENEVRHPLELNVGADTTKAMAEVDLAAARINAKDATIKVHVDIDKAGLGGIGDGVGGKGGLFSGLTGALSGFLDLGGKVPGVIGSIVGGLGSLFSTSLSAGQGIASLATSTLGMSQNMGAALGAVGAVATAVLSALGAVVQFGFQLAILGVIAGAITAAVGAVASAVSALPALAIGGGAAIGVLAIAFSNFGDALGRGKTGKELEKQNKALAALPPPAREAALAINGPLLTAFDALRNSIQTAFFQGFADQIRDLAARVIPQLTGSMSTLAGSLGGFILGLVQVASSAPGIEALNGAFLGMSIFIGLITPSVQALFLALLQAASTAGLWEVLAGIVQVLLGHVTELFARFSEGGGASLMVQSLSQLRDVLNAAAGAFVTLVLKATEFFTGAGPGLRDLFDSINRTLGEIDFAGLGESFGIFASAVGRFIDAVPPSVWQAIADAVRDLALKFQELSQDPQMVVFFQSLVATIPLAIDVFTTFLGVVQTAVGILLDVFTGVSAALEALGLLAPGTTQALMNAQRSMEGAAGPMGAAGAGVGRSAQQGVLDNMQGIDPGTRAALQRGIDAANGQAPAMGAAGQTFGQSAVQGATQGMAPLPPEVLAAAARGVDSVRGQSGPMQGAGNQVGTAGARGAQAGIAPMPGQVRNTTQQAHAGVRGESGGFSAAGRAIVDALKIAIQGGASAVISAAISIARAAWQAAKNFLGIASPSKLFRFDVGRWIPIGMALGISENAPVVATAVENMLGLANTGTGRQNVALGRTLGEQVATGVQQGLTANPATVVAEQGRVSSAMASWAAAGTVYEDGSVRGGKRAMDSLDDFAAAMQGLTWTVDLDPEGIARIAARGGALRNRR